MTAPLRGWKEKRALYAEQQRDQELAKRYVLRTLAGWLSIAAIVAMVLMLGGCGLS